MEKHSKQPIRFEGQLYSLCQE